MRKTLLVEAVLLLQLCDQRLACEASLTDVIREFDDRSRGHVDTQSNVKTHIVARPQMANQRRAC